MHEDIKSRLNLGIYFVFPFDIWKHKYNVGCRFVRVQNWGSYFNGRTHTNNIPQHDTEKDIWTSEIGINRSLQ